MSDSFKNHVAKYWKTQELGGLFERIQFKAPDTGNYACDFIAFANTLVVRGDTYEAIYTVGQNQSISFWALTDSHYLSQKISGLNGRSAEAKVWCSDKAKKDLDHLLEELKKEVIDDQDDDDFDLDAYLPALDAGDDEQFDGATLRLKQWRYWNPEDHLSSQHEFTTFVHNHGDDVFGECYWEIMGNFGLIINPMIETHLEALKLAVKQLKDQGVTFG